MDQGNIKAPDAGGIGLVVAGDGAHRSKPAALAPKPEESGQFSVNALSEALAQTVVNTFTDQLKLEAQRHGGYLTVNDISQLSEKFHRKRGQLERVFQQSFEQVARARERAAFDHVRAYPFDRLIVSTFEVLFSPERAVADGPDAVTRRVLPGFFLSMDMMIGKDMVREFQERCQAIVARLSQGQEQSFNWQVLYDDREAKDCCLDALVAFAPYFKDWEKRRDWYLPLINGNLDASDDWELTEGGLANLAGVMFSQLKSGLDNPRIRATLENRHGRSPCVQLDLILAGLAEAGLKLS
ncbi:MAG: hypothetical protein VYE18_02190 [Pseudomonadota bacterium]|nr:hypothetical protein [Pseudomonadota bacterium]